MAQTTGDYTLRNLDEVEDKAAAFGIGHIQEARMPRDELAAQDTGLSFYRVHPDQRIPFGHRHDSAEEVYVVIAGSGRFKLDDDLVDVRRLDAIRVAPDVVRAFEAGPDGMEVLAFGPRHEGDGELVQGWWDKE